jgi:anti-sigma B factor antagonist
MSMELTQDERADGTVVIAVSGKVMMGPDSEPITQLVEDLLRAGKRRIVFDIAGVTRIDSTGIGRFIYAYNRITAEGGQMRMAAAPSLIFRIFHLSLLDTVIHFYPSVEAACQA